MQLKLPFNSVFISYCTVPLQQGVNKCFLVTVVLSLDRENSYKEPSASCSPGLLLGFPPPSWGSLLRPGVPSSILGFPPPSWGPLLHPGVPLLCPGVPLLYRGSRTFSHHSNSTLLSSAVTSTYPFPLPIFCTREGEGEKERRGGRERGENEIFPSAGSFSKSLQQAELGQAEARSGQPGSSRRSPSRAQGLRSTWAIFRCFPCHAAGSWVRSRGSRTPVGAGASS